MRIPSPFSGEDEFLLSGGGIGIRLWLLTSAGGENTYAYTGLYIRFPESFNSSREAVSGRLRLSPYTPVSRVSL